MCVSPCGHWHGVTILPRDGAPTDRTFTDPQVSILVEVVMLRALSLIVLAVQTLAPSDVAFEAASVKPNRDGGGVRIDYHPGGRLVATNVTVRQLVRSAWRIHDLQLQGGPSWVTRDTFDVVATAGRAMALTPEDAPPGPMQQMLQTLLEQRFQVKVHTERREMNVYALVSARAVLGPGLRKSTSDCIERPPCERYGTATQLRATAVTIAQITSTLALRMGRPIVDRTGLEGFYDAELQFSADWKGGVSPASPTDDAPPIVTAVQEQLGLKLEPVRAGLDVLIIDAAERPIAD
jgi:uncharacterized protein (TIGR03435 family)